MSTPPAPGTLVLRADAFPWPSANAAARACGLAPSSVWRVLNGRTDPSARFVAAILRGSGRTFDELFDVVDA